MKKEGKGKEGKESWHRRRRMTYDIKDKQYKPPFLSINGPTQPSAVSLSRLGWCREERAGELNPSPKSTTHLGGGRAGKVSGRSTMKYEMYYKNKALLRYQS
jgi:hypothetical protein